MKAHPLIILASWLALGGLAITAWLNLPHFPKSIFFGTGVLACLLDGWLKGPNEP
jgi:hypothetical protein